MKKLQEERERVYNERYRSLLALSQQKTEIVCEAGAQQSYKEQCIRLQYEVEVANTSKRALERELSLLKRELSSSCTSNALT